MLLLLSRKAGFLLAVFLLLVVGGIGAVAVFRRAPKPQPAQKFALRDDQIQRLNQDSDNDGLKDWEELIYHTDPHNPDTDGDGTPDGEEIKQGRNPLVPNTAKVGEPPNDKLAAPLSIKNSPYLADDNLTGQLAQKFNMSVVIPKLLDPSRQVDIQTVAAQIANSSAPSFSPVVYTTEKDIKTKSDNSVAAFHQYNTDKDAILLASFQNLSKPAIQIFADALQVDDLSAMKKLDVYLRAYDTVLPKIKNMIVPSQAVSLHVQHLNTIATQRDAIFKMRNAEVDIVQAISGAQEFAAAVNDIQTLAKEFQKLPR